MRTVKIAVEKHDDAYVAYPLGIEGVVVGEGDTYEEAITDVKSALAVYVETFGTMRSAHRKRCGRSSSTKQL